MSLIERETPAQGAVVTKVTTRDHTLSSLITSRLAPLGASLVTTEQNSEA